jgi:hypothetical protein
MVTESKVSELEGLLDEVEEPVEDTEALLSRCPDPDGQAKGGHRVG